jgi:hypothetical protein
MRHGRARRGLTTPRGAVPNGPGCQENDPRSSSNVEKRRAQVRAQALATQGSPLTAVAQRSKFLRCFTYLISFSSAWSLLFVQIQLMCGAARSNLLSVNASSDDPNQLNVF